MDGTNRIDIRVGATVAIVKKADQRSGALTQVVVQTILTKSPKHSHGIKVRLASGEIGRVKQIFNTAT